MPNAVEPRSASPRTLAEALELLAAPTATCRGDRSPGAPTSWSSSPASSGSHRTASLDLWALDELRGIVRDGNALVIGALTTYTELRRSPVVAEFLPGLVEAAATIGAAQIQNRGTIGGNAINASPAGDTLPILLALGAELVLASAGGERTVSADDFWPAYRTTARRDDELLVRIRIPLDTTRQLRFRKIGTRRAQAISKVVVALAWRTSADGGPWTDVRLALGSVAATTVRASATEAVLEGAHPTRDTADAAADALAAELRPIDDVRSTADYRRLVAGRVLHRLIRDEGGW